MISRIRRALFRRRVLIVAATSAFVVSKSQRMGAALPRVVVYLDVLQEARRLAAEVQHDYRQASQPKIEFKAAAGAHALARLAPHVGHHGLGRVQACGGAHIVDFSRVDDVTSRASRVSVKPSSVDRPVRLARTRSQ